MCNISYTNDQSDQIHIKSKDFLPSLDDLERPEAPLPEQKNQLEDVYWSK